MSDQPDQADHEHQNQSERHRVEPAAERTHAHPLRIALAEDDADLRAGLAALLEADGHVVEAFGSGGSLVEHLAPAILEEPNATRPDVIITDVRMPGFNGLAIVEGLRANGWRLPVIIMSAFADDAMKARVLRLGSAALFEKPLDVERFERLVGKLMDTDENGNQDEAAPGPTVLGPTV